MTTTKNIYVHQGTDFTHSVDVATVTSGVTITDSSMFSSGAQKMYSSGTVFNLTVNSDISGNTVNSIDLFIPDTLTANTITTPPGKYRYDLIVTESGTKTKLQEGLLILLPSISS